jgi:broad specificity phosphatase PhoE
LNARRSLFLIPLLLAAGAASPARPAPATIVFVVRHAERAPGSGDVAISEQGVARARALAEITKQVGVQAIVTTQFLRTKQTAAPTADALGLTATVVATQADLPSHLAAVAAAARQHAGKTVLVVGHSNTVPGIVAALGGTKYPDLCDAEYDALFTVVIDVEGGVRTVRTRFGAPTPVGTDCAAMR